MQRSSQSFGRIYQSYDGTGAGVTLTQDGSGHGLLIDKNDISNCLVIDQTANSASPCTGLKMSVVNDGAGPEYAFWFAGSEVAVAAGGYTQTETLKIVTPSGVRYIYIYSD